MIATLEKLPLFSYFDREVLGQILAQSDLEEFPPGTRVIVQGDPGRDLMVLLSGQLKVQKHDSTGMIREIAEIRPVSIFGEISVIEETPRTAEVICDDVAKVLRVPANTLKALAKESRYIKEINNFKNAIMINQYFSSAPLFRDLPQEVIHMFTAAGQLFPYKRGEIVFHEGTMGDSFFLIIRGSVEVLINGRLVNRIQQGGFFGEISVIADIPRTATIRAADNLLVLKVTASDFWVILSQNIEMAMFIETVGEMRLKEDVHVMEAIDLFKVNQ